MIAFEGRIRKLAWVALAALSLGCAESDTDNTDLEQVSVVVPADGILLISIDTLRADRLGSYGYVRETSPALDCMVGPCPHTSPC